MARLLHGAAGLFWAYVTVVLLALSGWTVARTASEWVPGALPLLVLAAATGLGAAWHILAAARPASPWWVVPVLGPAPAVLTLCTAPRRF